MHTTTLKRYGRQIELAIMLMAAIGAGATALGVCRLTLFVMGW